MSRATALYAIQDEAGPRLFVHLRLQPEHDTD